MYSKVRITVIVQDYQKFRLSKKSFIVKLHIKLDGDFKQGQKKIHEKKIWGKNSQRRDQQRRPQRRKPQPKIQQKQIISHSQQLN